MNVLPPTLADSDVDDGSVDIARESTSLAEQNELGGLNARKLRNASDEQDMSERIRYADHAYGITQAWIGFLIVITIMQFCLKPMEMGLSDAAFITVFTTTTASIFGFWHLVGRYLFNYKDAN